MNQIISLREVSKTFTGENGQKLRVLQDINLEIAAGEFFVCVGPSGSGKSTLLRIMSGLEKEYSGEIAFAPGISRRDVGFVFQQFALLPWLTVAQNIELGLIARRVSSPERQAKVRMELTQLRLEKFASTRPRDLSGGMRQRVGIARALAAEPKILFLDEPFSELDSFIAEELRQELLRVWQERKLTVVMVTHIVPEAVELADRIAVMTPRPGRIEKIVCNALPRPRSPRSREFYAIADEVTEIIRP